jgi:hypothetical protein
MTAFFEKDLKIDIPNKEDFFHKFKTPLDLIKYMGRTSFKLKPVNIHD